MDMTKYLAKSPWLLVWETGGCNGCIIETLASVTPRFDVERFGILAKGTPRHADIFMVHGTPTRQNAKRLKRLYEQMPDPKVVVAVGACASGGGVFKGCYGTHGPVENVIPVDVYVPGCPPKPEAIILGVVKAIDVLKKRGKNAKK
ncbi:MAG: NADH-quinone oxidoreductase subunit NuoB [archaeon]